MEKIGGKDLELLGGFHQPVEHGISVDLEDPGRASDAEPFSQAGDDMDDELRRRAFAMEDRAVCLVKISLARHTLKLAPGLTTGMAIGADIAQTEPAMIGAIGIGTEMPRRIDGTFAAPVEEDDRRW